MKKFCRYAVIDIQTGYLLAGGQKMKDFENGKFRYVYCGNFRCFPRFWVKITECFRTLVIKNRPCCIVYWQSKKVGEEYNYITLAGQYLSLNGCGDLITDNRFKAPCYSRLLRIHGVLNENI